MSEQKWPDQLVEAVSAEIKARRLELGLSIYALSQTSGVSQQAIAYYERLHRRPSLEYLAKISKALDIQLSALIRRAEDRLS